MICLPVNTDSIKCASSQKNEHLNFNNNDVARLETEQQFRIKYEQQQRLKAMYEAKIKMTNENKNKDEIKSKIVNNVDHDHQSLTPEQEYEERIRLEHESRRNSTSNLNIDPYCLRLEDEQKARIKAQQEARLKALYEVKITN